MKKRILALALALSLLLSACGGGAKATTMHLVKTEGAVGVSDGGGKDVESRNGLGLYSGYGVNTRSESYAWVDLDDVKLTKLDENSEIEITKAGKELEIEVKSGALFFNVTQPLAEDETMTIRSSTMAVGIRGTCGWVEVPDPEHMNVYLLEGEVKCSNETDTAAVRAGEMGAVSVSGSIVVEPFSFDALPEFVRAELENSGGTAGQEGSVYPLHAIAEQRLYQAGGTICEHKTMEYDEFGYELRSTSTFYDPNGYQSTSYIYLITHDHEAGTYVRIREDDPELRSEGESILGALDRIGGSTINNGSDYVSCDPLDRTSAQHRAEIRANGGRLDIPSENSYVIYSYDGDSDFPSSSVTYTMDGTMTGYAEFEWQIIDPYQS